MATIDGTIDFPPDDAAVAVRRAAGELGWAWHEGQSDASQLVFAKGVKAFSWGSELRVSLEPIPPSATRLRVSTAEKWALSSWGRGSRAAHRLLDTAGARID